MNSVAPKGVRLRDETLGRIASPLGAAVAAATVAVAAYVITPGGSTFTPPCPLHALTGIDCPGCGTTRALHALTHGDLVAAAHNNVLLLVAIPCLAYLWVAWTAGRFGRDTLPIPRPSSRAMWTVGFFVIAFGVLRNFDIGPLAWIAPIPV